MKFDFILDWIVGAMEQKKLLNWLAMSFGLVRNSPLLLIIISGDSDSSVFKGIIDLNQKHLFNIINVVSEIIIILCFSKVDKLFLYVLYSSQGYIQRGFATGQLVWDPKFLSQIKKKLKILMYLILI